MAQRYFAYFAFFYHFKPRTETTMARAVSPGESKTGAAILRFDVASATR